MSAFFIVIFVTLLMVAVFEISSFAVFGLPKINPMHVSRWVDINEAVLEKNDNLLGVYKHGPSTGFISYSPRILSKYYFWDKTTHQYTSISRFCALSKKIDQEFARLKGH